MGSFSIWHWIIVLLLVMLLFGRGKISDLMGDVAKGIKTFKKGMADDEETEAKAPTIEHDSPAPMASETADKKAKVG
jgi:sec-independent protein translocase protein TatA